MVEYYLSINTVKVLARGCTGSLQGFCLAHHISVCHAKDQISVCRGSVLVYGGFPCSLPHCFLLWEAMWICGGAGGGGFPPACSASWGADQREAGTKGCSTPCRVLAVIVRLQAMLRCLPLGLTCNFIWGASEQGPCSDPAPPSFIVMVPTRCSWVTRSGYFF